MKLNPRLNEGVYVYAFSKNYIADECIVCCFKEDEGYSYILPEIHELNVQEHEKTAWITCTTNTSLTDTGITAAFSAILSKAGISCNVVAAVHHDHIFVPYADRGKAIELLKSL